VRTRQSARRRLRRLRGQGRFDALLDGVAADHSEVSNAMPAPGVVIPLTSDGKRLEDGTASGDAIFKATFRLTKR
jgi:hypothetical protein